ncbi:nucleotide exchange factor GrpE [Magnetococcales bacterium HHB-1]
MAEDTRTHLLEAFKHYLDQIDDDSLPVEGDQQTDLYKLFIELAALRNEVRMESRQFNRALERFNSWSEPLKEGYGRLNDALDLVQQQKDASHKAETRQLLLDLIDLHDRMRTALQATKPPPPPPPTRSFFKKSEPHHEGKAHWLAIQEGWHLIMQRFDRLLAQQNITRIDTEGKTFNPDFMRAVETVSKPHLEHGLILDSIQPGYLWNNELLRLAEVRVNRKDKADE